MGHRGHIVHSLADSPLYTALSNEKHALLRRLQDVKPENPKPFDWPEPEYEWDWTLGGGEGTFRRIT